VRKAFRMSLNGDAHEEYARRHNPIWRELEDTLIAHGVSTYSIYLDPVTSDLFAYVEVESEQHWRAITSSDVCRRWWRHMRDLMPSNPDNSPVTRDLREVFHLEAGGAAASVVAGHGLQRSQRDRTEQA
jgi:L-rhamnose mutarotase